MIAQARDVIRSCLKSTPPNLDPDLRDKLLQAALRGAATLQYSSAGTFEFLVWRDQFYLLELNTRIQVEHPITEIVTGVDIVKEQILIAGGERLSVQQEDVRPRGHAMEFRINAEDPYLDFLPSCGTIYGYNEPRLPWLRIDSACYEGYVVLPYFDSLLSKLIVSGRTRDETITRGKIALANYQIAGVATTIPFHLAILDDPKFQAGKMTTNYVESDLAGTFKQRQHQSSTEVSKPYGVAEDAPIREHA